MKAKWVFSAASHGKGVVDGKSGITKRLVRTESLRRKDNFIKDVHSMFAYLVQQNNDALTDYILITQNQINTYVDEKELKKRYELYKTVPGTRSYHDVEPLNRTTLVLRKVSGSNETFVCKTFGNISEQQYMVDVSKLKFGDFLCFHTEGLLQLGTVSNYDRELGEVTAQLMRKTKGAYYSWYTPERTKIFPAMDCVTAFITSSKKFKLP
ncbi:unnamed protein product [Allacma fusca]|uniref:Uncharacterized protein n=1 Tax=Allacma fusca TaxID=39272 RepID=A0A8J2JJA6_9HEXA|nr:unnamed protein product [Allacma fusca]